MRGLQGQSHVKVIVQLRQRLAGQGVHQVEVEGVKGFTRFLYRGNGLGAVVYATQGLQVLVIKALHAHRQAGNAGFAEGSESVFFKRAGVGL